jgi:hypothetical protein
MTSRDLIEPFVCTVKAFRSSLAYLRCTCPWVGFGVRSPSRKGLGT